LTEKGRDQEDPNELLEVSNSVTLSTFPGTCAIELISVHIVVTDTAFRLSNKFTAYYHQRLIYTCQLYFTSTLTFIKKKQ
jgi:hypothetical protein